MYFFIALMLFIWLFILHEEVRDLKVKLQKYINEGYVARRSAANRDVEIQEKNIEESPVLQEINEPEKVVEEPSAVLYDDYNESQNEHVKEIREIIEETEIRPIKPDKSGFEKFFLGNVFNKIGAVALIIGIGFFVKVVSEFIVFTPLMRISAAFLAGLLMITGSFKLHKDNMKNYAEVLMGTGVAVMFITIYCAVGLYSLMPMSAALVFGFLLVIFTYIISEKYKCFSTFLIGFLGGYLNPFFINSNISLNFLAGYLVFLNLISVVYVLKNENKRGLNYLNLILTFFTLIIFNIFKGDDFNYLYSVGLWALFVINNIVFICKNKDSENSNSQMSLNYLNYAVLIGFTKFFNPDKFIETGLFVLCAVVVYSVMLNIVKTKDNETVKAFSHGAVLSLLGGTYFTLEGTARVVVWVLEGAVLSYIASKYKYLQNWALSFFLVAFMGIFFVKNVFYYEDITAYSPIFNFRLILFGVPVFCGILASIILKENEKISNILKFLYIALIYLFAVCEINLAYEKYADVSHVAFKLLTYSIVGFIYSINVKRMGMSLKSVLFEYAAAGIFTISTILLLLNSWSAAGDIPVLNLRFIAYMFAIGACVYYSLNTKNSMYNYLALILGFLGVHCEVSYFTQSNAFAISVAWILYAGLITLIGIFRNINVFKKAGIWISILAVLKIMVLDIIGLEPQYKIITFMTLGVILMVVSFFYTKFLAKDKS